MNILEKIVAQKKIEVEQSKKKRTVKELESMPLFNKDVLSISSFLKDENRTGIIAEFKRKSPSKGVINDIAPVKEVVQAYGNGGASAVSVLTDESFFGGSLQDLSEAKEIATVPLLRKDFMIDEYQIIEAKTYGASVILLIAACLTQAEVKHLSKAASNLGLEVLLEIHNDEELDHICDAVNLVGVNNRNLKTFHVDIETSLQLIEKIPASKIPITESGISDVETINRLRQAGYKGFLIGENFMKTKNPAIAFADFVHQLKAKK